MVRFINPDNGMVFDGSRPYVFWFDEGQSVNLNYVKKIYYVSTDPTSTVTLNSTVFALLDVSGIAAHTTAQEVFDGQKYYDLQGMKTTSLTLSGTETSTGSGIYVYAIYILAFSDNFGECIDEFSIDGDTYSIGADFYAEDERLTTTLGNFGVTIPYDVQKAIYEENVHEEAQDNILLNRKYKELLMHYWEIIVNKGNYRSLTNSLDWFEYGDLLTLREFWNEPGTNYNYYDKINTLVDEDIEHRIQKYMKKTYLGVYFALNHVKRSDDGDVIYEGTNGLIWGGAHMPLRSATLIPVGSSDDPLQPDSVNQDRLLQIGGGTVNIENHSLTDPLVGSNWEYLTPSAPPSWYDGNNYFLNDMDPELAQTVALHTTTDLALKMTLLGNYYSTFFMPIQMDLIHATVEAMVYTSCLKILDTTLMGRYDVYGVTKGLRCTVTSDFKLQPMKNLFVYPDTLFGGYDGVTEPIVYMGIEEARYVPVPPTPDELPNYFYVENISAENTLSIGLYFDDEPSEDVSFDFYVSENKIEWTKLDTLDMNTDNVEYAFPDGCGRLYVRCSAVVLADYSINYFEVNITCADHYNVGGNVMSLLYGEDFTGEETQFPEGYEEIEDGGLEDLFCGSETLISAKDLVLPMTELTIPYAYYGMFDSCTSLTAAPQLPATTLSERCYQGMFFGCTSLTAAPELPATTMNDYCYENMFRGCTSLVNPPLLPATELAEECYCYMFDGCSSLTAAPELRATNLVEGCYMGMFSGCSLLSYVMIHAEGEWDNIYTEGWLWGVSDEGVLYNRGHMTGIPTHDTDGCPDGWTVVPEENSNE